MVGLLMSSQAALFPLHVLTVHRSDQMSLSHLSRLFSHVHSLLVSLCAAINLLGLTWQLKPSDGPLLNNGLGAGLPVNSDVATLPSGGRGMNCGARTDHFLSTLSTWQQMVLK